MIYLNLFGTYLFLFLMFYCLCWNTKNMDENMIQITPNRTSNR